ncbi:3-oxoacyl-(acyl carrier protein) synthase I [Acetobacteraceae bacterium AT-5844]|nr:3-oxoacyl-(acyl carrier protein) synthase I [Acetobacteraceae bacterium AT-5844]
MHSAFFPLALSAYTAVSAIGTGLDATRKALQDRQGGLRPAEPDDAPARWVGRVTDIEAVELPPELARFSCRNNRLAELALRQDGFAAAVEHARQRFGAGRVAVILGTSTSGIAETEAAYRRRPKGQTALPDDFDFAATHDLFSLPRFVRARLGLSGPAFSISTACTSGARAFMEASTMIQLGLCDAAVVGGVDTLCRMTLQGFGSLALLSEGPTRPCASDRDGITVGEAAGFALVVAPQHAPSGTPVLLGAGASSDGHHMSSPHPEGLGAVSAMQAALAASGLEPGQIDYINLHGTGTRANDSMEARAVAHLFGREVPCSSTKGWTGHTLGASGALEAVIAALSIQDGLMPGCLGVTEIDPEFEIDIVTANRSAPIRHVLSNSFGFGGSNCSLIIGAPAGAGA